MFSEEPSLKGTGALQAKEEEKDVKRVSVTFTLLLKVTDFTPEGKKNWDWGKTHTHRHTYTHTQTADVLFIGNSENLK